MNEAPVSVGEIHTVSINAVGGKGDGIAKVKGFCDKHRTLSNQWLNQLDDTSLFQQGHSLALDKTCTGRQSVHIHPTRRHNS